MSDETLRAYQRDRDAAIDRAERAEAQLAALREACRPALRVLDKLGVDEWAAFDTVIAYTAPAAEAHDEMMRAEGRDEAMADFTAARLFEAERDALAGQLAALREAVREVLDEPHAYIGERERAVLTAALRG